MSLKLIQGKQIDVNLTGSFSGSFTGTLLGTSSNALTASYVNPLVQNVYITGSLTQGAAGNRASGLRSHAEGYFTTATGSYSHAEGEQTISSGTGSHAEGSVLYGYSGNIYTEARGDYSHAEGQGTLALGYGSHAEGASYDDGFLYTYPLVAYGTGSHAEGLATLSSGSYSHAEGYLTTAIGNGSHAEGEQTLSPGIASHAEGSSTISSGNYSHAEGYFTTATEDYSHAEGYATNATGESSHAEGYITTATGIGSHAEGQYTNAIGDCSHAEGNSTIAFGGDSHAEGNSSYASGSFSHAEGVSTLSSGFGSHAEGSSTISSGEGSHAEGLVSLASGIYSHAEGSNTISSGQGSHAEGTSTEAQGDYSHTEGQYTVASGSYQHVQGQFNISSSVAGAFIHGNGTSLANRSNLIYAYDSIVEITGSLNVSGSITGSLLGTASYAVSTQTASYAPLYLPLAGGTMDTGADIRFTNNSRLRTGSTDQLRGGYYGISLVCSVDYELNWQAGILAVYAQNSSTIIPLQLSSSLQMLPSATVLDSSARVSVEPTDRVLRNINQDITLDWEAGVLYGTASNAATASNILGGKATHIPYFITDTTLATSSLYQSGSTSVIINQDSNTVDNPEALYVWQPHPTSINVISGKGDLDNYLQLNIQNTSIGSNASSDIVATANNGSEVDNYIDMGINSQYFNGFLGGPNDSYLYSHGHDMWIGNTNDGYELKFFNSSSQQPIITLTSQGQANITGSLYGTASWALNSLQANNATQAVSASHALQADDATVANYANTAGNGGVTSIVAGSGITLPFGGTGNVTIVAGGGGGGVTVISGSNVTQSFANESTWTFNHNLGVRTPIIEVFDTNYNQVIPQNIQLVSTSSAVITFPNNESGFAVASVGGVTGNAVSSSYSLFATYADSASYYPETDPIFVAKSGSLATTGSNIFKGNQTITGSVFINSGSSLNLNGNTLYSSASTIFTNANIVPTQHNTQSLGTTTERWKDVWIGSGTIYIADSVIPNSDLAIEAINNILTISGSAGLEVGSFKFVNNELFLKNEGIPIIIGSGSATAPIQLKRPLEIISGETGNLTFRATREGRVAIIPPNIPAGDIGAFSIIGNSSGSYQPVVNAGGLIHLTSNDGVSSRITSDAFGTAANAAYVGRKARGTALNPLPVQSGDILTRISSIGWTGPEYGFAMSSSIVTAPTTIDVVALENYTTSSFGSRFNFYNVPSSSSTRTLSAQIDTTGITIPSSSRFFGTASWALNTLTASYVTSSNIVGTVLSSSYALTASYAGDYVLTSATSSMLAPYVLTSSTSSMSVATASYVQNAQTASYYIETDPIFTAKSGSFATTGSNIFIGDQTISGSLKVSGSLTEIGTTVMSGSLTLSSGSAFNLNDGFFVNGHKQFQYASFYHTASQTVTSTSTPLPFQFSTIENNSGAFTVALSGSRRSRITTNTTGWWNVQYSAQVTNGSTFNNYDSYTWIRVNEANVVNSNNIRTIPQDSFDLLASRNTLIYLESGSYFEVMYGASNTLVSFPYTAAGASPTRPATPSITLVITQHA